MQEFNPLFPFRLHLYVLFNIFVFISVFGGRCFFLFRTTKWGAKKDDVLTQRQRNVNCSKRLRARLATSPLHRFPNWRTGRGRTPNGARKIRAKISENHEAFESLQRGEDREREFWREKSVSVVVSNDFEKYCFLILHLSGCSTACFPALSYSPHCPSMRRTEYIILGI